MPGDQFKRVFAGQQLQISAATWNTLLRGSENHQKNSFGPVSVRSPLAAQSGLLVRVKNNAGADVDQFCPLMLDGGSEFTPGGEEFEDYSFRHTPILLGVEPTADPEAVFVITQEPIADGDFGLCCLFGMTVANVDVTHADHTHATLKDTDATQLSSAMFGHRIYYKTSGTGTKLAYVSLGAESCNPYKGVATESIGANTSGAFKFATGLLGSLVAVGSEFSGIYAASTDAGSIDIDAELFVSRILGEWVLTPVECPA